MLVPSHPEVWSQLILQESHSPPHWTHGRSPVLPSLNALWYQMVTFLHQSLCAQ